MVLEIRISNFYSIREEVCLDFRAAPLKSALAKAVGHNTFRFKDTDVLKALVLYGANASGKSNVIKAIRLCHGLILHSHLHNADARFRFTPFKFDGYTSRPSHYSIRFVLHHVEYVYAFSLTTTEIVTESLHYYPKGRIKEIFSRDERLGPDKRNIYRFGHEFKRPFDVAESTSNKTLFISRASQMDRDLAKSIYAYFNDTFILNYVNFGIEAIEHLGQTNKTQVLEALKFSDSDIVDFQVRKIAPRALSPRSGRQDGALSVEDALPNHLQILTFHRKNPEQPFDFIAEESQGTIKLFFIILALLEVAQNNKILLVDEIEESLHPKLLAYVFSFFNASNHAQLLCTTHNTALLSTKKFRKDQICFVNKTPESATEVYSLHDFKDFRDTMDVEKAYLQGRFDAIPYIHASESYLKDIVHEQAGEVAG